MKVGVPKEVKNHEYRVAITPIGVHELVAHGHQVYVEKSAGVGSSISDDEYVAAGAEIVPDADAAWGADGGVDLVLKVKEPIPDEYHRMREGLTLFTYLHLAADKTADGGAVEPQGHCDRLRDRAAALGRASVAVPDVGGCGLSRAPGRRLLSAQG